ARGRGRRVLSRGEHLPRRRHGRRPPAPRPPPALARARRDSPAAAPRLPLGVGVFRLSARQLDDREAHRLQPPSPARAEDVPPGAGGRPAVRTALAGRPDRGPLGARRAGRPLAALPLSRVPRRETKSAGRRARRGAAERGPAREGLSVRGHRALAERARAPDGARVPVGDRRPRLLLSWTGARRPRPRVARGAALSTHGAALEPALRRPPARARSRPAP